MPNPLSMLFASSFGDDVARGNNLRVRMALAAGVNPNKSEGDPYLFRAVESGRIDTIKLLIGAGAAPNARNRQGDTPLLFILRGKKIEAARTREAPRYVQQYATESNKKNVTLTKHTTLTWVLDDITRHGGRGRDTQVRLSGRAHEIVVALLAGGANPNTTSNGETFYRQTPLMVAAEWGDIRIVSTLLSAGAAANAQDAEGESALMYAAFAGMTDVIDPLKKAGANVNAANVRGETALHLAARHDHADTVKALIAAGADPALRNTGGMTAYEIAAKADAKSTMGICPKA